MATAASLKGGTKLAAVPGEEAREARCSQISNLHVMRLIFPAIDLLNRAT
jgi:hypothetical protein